MPTIQVKISYDGPLDAYWLNPDNVRICLENFCKNSEFIVEWADFSIPADPWKKEQANV